MTIEQLKELDRDEIYNYILEKQLVMVDNSRTNAYTLELSGELTQSFGDFIMLCFTFGYDDDRVMELLFDRTFLDIIKACNRQRGREVDLTDILKKYAEIRDNVICG